MGNKRSSSLIVSCCAWWRLCVVGSLRALVIVIASWLFCRGHAADSGPDTLRLSSTNYPSFASWKVACDRLPLNRQLQRTLPPRDQLPLKNFSEFDELLDAFFAASKSGSLAQAGNWVGTPPSSQD